MIGAETTRHARPRERPPQRTLSCLAYCALPYSGRGWPQTCTSIIAGFAQAGLEATLVLPRTRRPLPPSITLASGLKYPMTKLPWNVVSALGAAQTRTRFRRLLDDAEPADTIAYFWPGAPADLVLHARRRGILTVREMINTYQGTAKRILDEAYGRLDLSPAHGITDDKVNEERAELALYDYIFAPAPGVEASLAEAGIASERILRGTYGWSPSRFGRTDPRRTPAEIGTRFLFVGIIGIRKGVPELLDAWAQSRVRGELILVGQIEPALSQMVEAAIGQGSVRHLGFTSDLALHYAASDVFVFPTLEEGCPQVVMEAAGCGLPVITTPMGAGRLVEHGRNGLVVDAGDTAGLARAIRQLDDDAELRHTLASHMHADARAVTYERIGQDRARILVGLLSSPVALEQV